MAKVEKFEDLNCWKEARKLVNVIFRLCQKEVIKNDRDLVSQMKRASIGVMNNIAEGFGRYSDKEFIRFLDFSQSSALELRSMSYVLIDLNYISQDEFTTLQSQINETKNLTLGLIKYIKNKNKK